MEKNKQVLPPNTELATNSVQLKSIASKFWKLFDKEFKIFDDQVINQLITGLVSSKQQLKENFGKNLSSEQQLLLDESEKLLDEIKAAFEFVYGKNKGQLYGELKAKIQPLVTEGNYFSLIGAGLTGGLQEKIKTILTERSDKVIELFVGDLISHIVMVGVQLNYLNLKSHNKKSNSIKSIRNKIKTATGLAFNTFPYDKSVFEKFFPKSTSYWRSEQEVQQDTLRAKKLKPFIAKEQLEKKLQKIISEFRKIESTNKTALKINQGQQANLILQIEQQNEAILKQSVELFDKHLTPILTAFGCTTEDLYIIKQKLQSGKIPYLDVAKKIFSVLKRNVGNNEKGKFIYEYLLKPFTDLKVSFKEKIEEGKVPLLSDDFDKFLDKVDQDEEIKKVKTDYVVYAQGVTPKQYEQYTQSNKVDELKLKVRPDDISLKAFVGELVQLAGTLYNNPLNKKTYESTKESIKKFTDILNKSNAKTKHAKSIEKIKASFNDIVGPLKSLVSEKETEKEKKVITKGKFAHLINLASDPYKFIKPVLQVLTDILFEDNELAKKNKPKQVKDTADLLGEFIRLSTFMPITTPYAATLAGLDVPEKINNIPVMDFESLQERLIELDKFIINAKHNAKLNDSDFNAGTLKKFKCQRNTIEKQIHDMQTKIIGLAIQKLEESKPLLTKFGVTSSEINQLFCKKAFTDPTHFKNITKNILYNKVTKLIGDTFGQEVQTAFFDMLKNIFKVFKPTKENSIPILHPRVVKSLSSNHISLTVAYAKEKLKKGRKKHLAPLFSDKKDKLVSYDKIYEGFYTVFVSPFYESFFDDKFVNNIEKQLQEIPDKIPNEDLVIMAPIYKFIKDKALKMLEAFKGKNLLQIRNYMANQNPAEILRDITKLVESLGDVGMFDKPKEGFAKLNKLGSEQQSDIFIEKIDINSTDSLAEYNIQQFYNDKSLEKYNKLKNLVAKKKKEFAKIKKLHQEDNDKYIDEYKKIVNELTNAKNHLKQYSIYHRYIKQYVANKTELKNINNKTIIKQKYSSILDSLQFTTAQKNSIFQTILHHPEKNIGLLILQVVFNNAFANYKEYLNQNNEQYNKHDIKFYKAMSKIMKLMQPDENDEVPWLHNKQFFDISAPFYDFNTMLTQPTTPKKTSIQSKAVQTEFKEFYKKVLLPDYQKSAKKTFACDNLDGDHWQQQLDPIEEQECKQQEQPKQNEAVSSSKEKEVQKHSEEEKLRKKSQKSEEEQEKQRTESQKRREEQEKQREEEQKRKEEKFKLKQKEELERKQKELERQQRIISEEQQRKTIEESHKRAEEQNKKNSQALKRAKQEILKKIAEIKQKVPEKLTTQEILFEEEQVESTQESIESTEIVLEQKPQFIEEETKHELEVQEKQKIDSAVEPQEDLQIEQLEITEEDKKEYIQEDLEVINKFDLDEIELELKSCFSFLDELNTEPVKKEISKDIESYEYKNEDELSVDVEYYDVVTQKQDYDSNQAQQALKLQRQKKLEEALKKIEEQEKKLVQQRKDNEQRMIQEQAQLKTAEEKYQKKLVQEKLKVSEELKLKQQEDLRKFKQEQQKLEEARKQQQTNLAIKRKQQQQKLKTGEESNINKQTIILEKDKQTEQELQNKTLEINKPKEKPKNKLLERKKLIAAKMAKARELAKQKRAEEEETKQYEINELNKQIEQEKNKQQSNKKLEEIAEQKKLDSAQKNLEALDQQQRKKAYQIFTAVIALSLFLIPAAILTFSLTAVPVLIATLVVGIMGLAVMGGIYLTYQLKVKPFYKKEEIQNIDEHEQDVTNVELNPHEQKFDQQQEVLPPTSNSILHFVQNKKQKTCAVTTPKNKSSSRNNTSNLTDEIETKQRKNEISLKKDRKKDKY